MSELTIILVTGYTLATFGFVSSLTSLWIICKFKILHNAFGLISAAQSIVEGSILFFNVFHGYTVIILNPEAAQNFIIEFVGLLIAFLNGAVAYLQLLKAINRSLAIIFPLQYQNMFTFKRTTVYLAIICIFSLMHSCLYIFDSCLLVLNTTTFSWQYIFTSVACSSKSGYIYVTWSRITVLGLTLFFDGITFFYLRMFRKKLLQQNKKMMTAEIRFFFQTFLTSIFYTIMIFSPRLLRPYSTTPFLYYVTVSATLLFFHSSNEFFFIIFTVFINKNAKSSTHNTVVVISPKTKAKPLIN